VATGYSHANKEWTGPGGPTLKDALRKAIKLGLDLRGGIHLVLQVNTADAVKAERDDAVETLKTNTKDAGIGAIELPTNTSFAVVVDPKTDQAKLEEAIKRFLPDWTYSTAGGKWTFVLKEPARRQLGQVDGGEDPDRCGEDHRDRRREDRPDDERQGPEDRRDGIPRLARDEAEAEGLPGQPGGREEQDADEDQQPHDDARGDPGRPAEEDAREPTGSLSRAGGEREVGHAPLLLLGRWRVPGSRAQVRARSAHHLS